MDGLTESPARAGPTPTTKTSLSYPEALRAVLGDLPIPVLFDVDIGHQPPQFTLINGAMAHVVFDQGSGSIVQTRKLFAARMNRTESP